MRRAVIPTLTLLVAAGAVTAPPTAGAARATATNAHPCAAATERCDGTITVPLDRADPSSSSIDVAFAFVPRTDRSTPATGTVFLNPGGPGSVLPNLETYQESLGPVLEHQDLLALDPRGFGGSSSTRCPDLDVYSDASIAACAAQLGPVATNLTAADMAADIDAVRTALGLPALTLYGNSYGTVFAQAYATRYPRSTAAVFLDSVVATGADGYARDVPSGPLASGVGMLDEVCAPSAACRTAVPDPGALLASVLDAVRAGAVLGVTPGDLTRLVTYVADPAVARELTAALAAAAGGDAAPLARLAVEFRPPPGATPEDDLGEEFAAALAYTCSDYRHGFDRRADPDERRRQLAALRGSEQPIAPFRSDDLPSEVQRDYADWCTNWPDPGETPVVPPGAPHPAVPALVVNGQLDTTTPPAGAAAVAARFPRGRYWGTPFGNHADGFGLGGPHTRCVRDVVRAFLTTPSDPLVLPDCDGERFRALGRFPRTAAELPPADLTRGRLDEADRRLFAVTHATAVDALARRAGPDPIAGLRGGTITVDEGGAVRLDRARFVADVAVTGTLRLDQDDRATAQLTATPDGQRPRRVSLSWDLVPVADATTVTGRLAGQRVTATVAVP